MVESPREENAPFLVRSGWPTTQEECFEGRYHWAMIRVLVLFVVFPAVVLRQSIPLRPTFQNYPAKRTYNGIPAVPKLDKDQRMFRTVIRTGAKSTVQFAGHFTVPLFGCGALCSSFYIVDSVSGRVFDGFSVEELPGQWLESQPGRATPRIQFIPSSRLLKIDGCPNEHDCGYYDYVMDDERGLKLVKKWLLPQKFQY